MDIPVNFLTWGMAFLPILLLIVLMVGFHWGAAEAAVVGMLVTTASSLLLYRADLTLIAMESAKGIWNALVILLIIWTAILLYQVGDEAKAFQAIRQGMRKLLPNELLLVLAMGWVFESFLQGITGFGVPVAVGAPLLIGIGMQPMWAVILPLLGQSWGNTFGTLAAAWDSLAMTAGLTAGSDAYFQAAFWTALFLLFWDMVVGIVICWFYGKGKAVRKGLPAVLLLALIQGGGELALSQVNTTLSCFLPSLLSLAVILLLGRSRAYRQEWRVEDSPIMCSRTAETEEEKPGSMTLLQAFVPYFLLSALTIAVLMIPALNQVLGAWKIGFAFPETVTGYGYVNAASDCYSPIAPLTHASMFLLLSALAGIVYYRRHGWIGEGGVRRIFARSIGMTLPSGMAVVGLIIMSRIMGGSGQTVVLAKGIANVLGRGYAFLAPFVGLLGTFMTGSNMSSNILFGEFQKTTAELLHLNAAAVLGGQSAGGAIGSAVSPSKIILGTTTANVLGQEGEVLRHVLRITIPAALLIGAALFLQTAV